MEVIYPGINSTTVKHPHQRTVGKLSILLSCMTPFPWIQQLNINPDPNWQTKTFTKTFLNIMSNFIPHETKRLPLVTHHG